MQRKEIDGLLHNHRHRNVHYKNGEHAVTHHDCRRSSRQCKRKMGGHQILPTTTITTISPNEWNTLTHWLLRCDLSAFFERKHTNRSEYWNCSATNRSFQSNSPNLWFCRSVCAVSSVCGLLFHHLYSLSLCLFSSLFLLCNDAICTN